MGGVVGHLNHIYDDLSLSFRDIKTILALAADGKLENCQEKLDGQNIVFSWSSDRGLLTARNHKDINLEGAQNLLDRFKNRGNNGKELPMFYALSEALVRLEAIKSLTAEQIEETFQNGKKWYSVEIIYKPAANVIEYDDNALIFHSVPVFIVGDGIERCYDSSQSQLLMSLVNKMQSGWKLSGPLYVNPKLHNRRALLTALNSINHLMALSLLTESSTLNDLLIQRLKQKLWFLKAPLVYDVIDRMQEKVGSPYFIHIKKRMIEEGRSAYIDTVKDLIKCGPKIVSSSFSDLESIIKTFSAEITSQTQSRLISHLNTSCLIKDKLEEQRARIYSEGDKSKIAFFEREYNKILDLNMMPSIEGLVFSYKDKWFKLTGNFAEVNQILGIYRYNRT